MNCVLLLMCWCDIRAAEQSSTKPFIWAGKCVRVSDRQRVPGVPGHRRGPLRPSYPFHPLVLPLSLSLSHTLFSALYSHLITFEQRHAGLFIEEWCFFISLCLFVALRSTEGFLAADVSSAALQRHGWNVEEKRGEKKRHQMTKNETKEGYDRVEDAWHLGVGRAFAWNLSGGSEKGYFCLRRKCKMSAQRVCVPVSHPLSLI